MTYERPPKYTAEEIEEAFHAEEPDCNGETDCPCENCTDIEHGWHELGWSSPGTTTKILLRGVSVPVIYIDGEGGGEGSGESVWMVLKIGSQYFKKDGYYASYDGTHWDGDVTEVRRRQVTVNIWEKTK